MEYNSKIKKRVKNLIQMLRLNETVDKLTTANSVHLYGHVLRRLLGFEAEGQRKKGDRRRHGKSRLRKKV